MHVSDERIHDSVIRKRGNGSLSQGVEVTEAEGGDVFLMS